MPGNDLDALAAELFKTFARFEYALKAAKFHRGDGAAEANWRSFAESVAEIFEKPASENFAVAIAYMLKHPPKKQVVDGGVLGWSVSAPQTDLQSDRVLIYVRRVRNNLFHGGSSTGGSSSRKEEARRSCSTLLRFSMLVWLLHRPWAKPITVSHSALPPVTFRLLDQRHKNKRRRTTPRELQRRAVARRMRDPVVEPAIYLWCNERRLCPSFSWPE